MFGIVPGADDAVLKSSCDKSSDLSQLVEIAMICNLILKYENTMPKISENAILHPVLCLYLGNYSVFTS